MLSDFLNYAFLTRALLGGILISLSASLLGTSLVLTRYSTIGDGLSHVGFGAVAIAAALSFSPLTVALPIVVVSALLLMFLSESNVVKGDSAIAMLSTVSMSVGVIAVSLSGGITTDLHGFLFGSILSMTKTDLIVSVILSIVVVFLFVFAYNQLFTITFDQEFATASGINVKLWRGLMAVLVAITIVLGMRIMGSVLISGLIVFPALSAMKVSQKYKTATLLSAVFSVICFITGLILSYFLDLPTGPVIIIVNGFLFLILSMYIKFFKKERTKK